MTTRIFLLNYNIVSVHIWGLMSNMKEWRKNYFGPWLPLIFSVPSLKSLFEGLFIKSCLYHIRRMLISCIKNTHAFLTLSSFEDNIGLFWWKLGSFEDNIGLFWWKLGSFEGNVGLFWRQRWALLMEIEISYTPQNVTIITIIILW